MIALFDIRDEKIFCVSVYLSERDTVQRLGMIRGPSEAGAPKLAPPQAPSRARS